jgi:hypothetical protein
MERKYNAKFGVLSPPQSTREKKRRGGEKRRREEEERRGGEKRRREEAAKEFLSFVIPSEARDLLFRHTRGKADSSGETRPSE